jgi:AcrR family transcriptional regulator
MRERYRAHVRHEVKQAALRQLAESGPAAVSISAIGKQLGMSGPALYRYFASRDELLTELTIDAYHDLADDRRSPHLRLFMRNGLHDPCQRFGIAAARFRKRFDERLHAGCRGYRLVLGHGGPLSAAKR